MIAITPKLSLSLFSLPSLIASGTLATLLALAPCVQAQNQTAPFDHRSSGLVEDSFTLDGNEYWTAENGGRIGHGKISSNFFEYQTVPRGEGLLRRIFFGRTARPDGPTGWAVTSTKILKTTNGGRPRSGVRCPCGSGSPRSPYEELYR